MMTLNQCHPMTKYDSRWQVKYQFPHFGYSWVMIKSPSDSKVLCPLLYKFKDIKLPAHYRLVRIVDGNIIVT